MFGLGAETRIYLASGATDMRVGADGLYARVVGVLQQDPLSGHLFLFANKRRDRLKVLYFDGTGLWVCSKRMQGGCLHWPQSETGRVQLSHTEFALLIGGIDLVGTKARKWYRRGISEVDYDARKTA